MVLWQAWHFTSKQVDELPAAPVDDSIAQEVGEAVTMHDLLRTEQGAYQRTTNANEVSLNPLVFVLTSLPRVVLSSSL